MKQLSPHTETQAEGLMFILMKSLRLFSRYTFHKNQPGRQLQFLPLAGMFACLSFLSSARWRFGEFYMLERFRDSVHLQAAGSVNFLFSLLKLIRFLYKRSVFILSFISQCFIFSFHSDIFMIFYDEIQDF